MTPDVVTFLLTNWPGLLMLMLLIERLAPYLSKLAPEWNRAKVEQHRVEQAREDRLFVMVQSWVRIGTQLVETMDQLQMSLESHEAVLHAIQADLSRLYDRLDMTRSVAHEPHRIKRPIIGPEEQH